MMLHTKFQGHLATGSDEEEFLRFLPYMGLAAIYPEYLNNFSFQDPWRLLCNLVTTGKLVSEEKSFEIVEE